LRQRLPADFPVFNVQVPPNEDRSHRPNSTLRALVDMGGEQPARTTNDKAVVRKDASSVNSASVEVSNGESQNRQLSMVSPEFRTSRQLQPVVRALSITSVAAFSTVFAFLNIFKNFHNKLILMGQMQEYNLNLFFRSNVHLKIRLCSFFGMTALKILTNHDQRHQKYLNHVGDKEP
jgi:hypothetical protein